MVIANTTNLSDIAVAASNAATFTDFSVEGYYAAIKPLLLFILGMFIYSVFIFKFYKFVARRDILKADHASHMHMSMIRHIFRSIWRMIKHIIVVPALVFFWFIVLVALLMMLSRTHTPETILIVSIALIATIRITAYYNEDLSKDLAKMIPFALLGVFIIDMTYPSFTGMFEMAKQTLGLWRELIYYLFFVVIVETLLRILYTLKKFFYGEHEHLMRKHGEGHYRNAGEYSDD